MNRRLIHLYSIISKFYPKTRYFTFLTRLDKLHDLKVSTICNQKMPKHLTVYEKVFKNFQFTTKKLQ